VLLCELGHDAEVRTRYEGQDADLLIALHGEKTQEGLMAFRSAHPDRPCIVALTGTDLYPLISATSLESLELADGVIVLQKKAIELIPDEFADKVTVVVQSVNLPQSRQGQNGASDHFEVCVVGHLREVKSPLLTARAARDLPVESSVRVRHAGGILEEQYREWVAAEEAINPRYEWLGELDSLASAALIGNSDLLVLTSVTEGGPAVLGEAIVSGVPVLSTKIDGAVGLLGEDYPGLFPVGDKAALTALLRRCEEDKAFYGNLKEASNALAEQFLPEREKASLDLAVENAISHRGGTGSASSG